MYVPYLYGRQGECRAIQDVATLLGAPQKVVPLIEPVNAKPNDLRQALTSLAASSTESFVIVNPARHDLQAPEARAAWAADLAPELSSALVRPTFEVRHGTALADLQAFVTSNTGRDIGVSIRSTSISPADVASATAGLNVVHFLHSSADPLAYFSAVGASRAIEVRDAFRTEARNADYSGEEQFTTAHLNYAASGQPGFSDYTLLPGTFNAGGGPLGAAAIHLSYVNPTDKSIWVQHFISDETRQYESTQPAKMMEAMAKIHAQVGATPTRFEKSPGLVSYESQFASATPTSPTYNKRQQISHHIVTASTVA